MSKTTPADLAVAFRSLDRRRSEAIRAADGAPVASLLAELDAHIAAAAALLGSPADGASIAAAIESRPIEDWDDTTLDALRSHATEAGTSLRRVIDAGPRDED